MAKIDELVLSMKFDNAKFKSAAQETLNTLDRLKSNLNFDGVKNAFKGSVLGAKDLDNAVQNVDLSKLSNDVSNINSKFSALGVVGGTAIAKLTSSAMSLGSKLTSAITQPLIQGGFNRAQNIEQARFMLQGLGADVAAVEKAAMSSVEGTAYGFDQAARAASQFYASGVTDMEAMEKALLGISGATAMTGANYEDISQIFTTVSGQGRVLSEQLNQFASRGLNVAATLAKHFGVTEGELRDMVSKNKVSFEDFYMAMSDAYGEHAKKAGDTFSGAMANAKAPLSRIGADVASVYLKQMTGLFNALKPFLDVVHGSLKPIIEFINKLQESRIGGLTNMLNSLTEGLQKGGDKKPAILGWIGDIGESIAHLLEQVSKIGGAIGKAFSNQFLGEWKGLRAFVDGAAASILKFVQTIQISDRFLLNVTRVFDALFSIVGFGLQIFKALSGSLLAIGDAVLRYILPPLSDFIGYITAVVAALFRFVTGTKGVEKGVGGLTWVIVNIIKVVGKFLSLITGAIDKMIEFVGRLREGKAFAEGSFPHRVAERFAKGVDAIAKALRNIKTYGLEQVVKIFDFLKTVVVEVSRTIGELFGRMDFTWLSDAFSWLKNINIGNPFKDFSLPSLDLSGATDSVKRFGASLRDSIRGGEGLSKITEPIKNAFSSAFNYIRNINWSGAFEGIKSGISTVGDLIGEAFGNAKEFLGNVDWAGLGSTIAEKLVAGFTKAKEISIKIGEFLKDAFTSAIEAIDPGKIWDNIKDFGKGVKDTLTGTFDDVKDKVEGVKDAIAENLDTTATVDVEVNTASLEDLPAENKLKNVSDGINELFKGMGDKKIDPGKIREAFGESLGSGIEAMSTTWGKMISGLGRMFEMIADPIGTAFRNARRSITEGFADLSNTTAEAGAKFSNGLLDILGDDRLTDFLNSLSGLMASLGILQLGSGVKAVGDAFKSIGGFFEGLTESVKGFVEVAKMNARADAILKIAISLGILAASLWVLSKIDAKDLAKGVLTLTATLGILFAFMFALSKFNVATTVGAQLLLISSSLGLLVLSIMALSKLDFNSVVNGLKIIGSTLIVLGVALGIFGLGLKAVDSKKMLSLAAGVVVMAAAVYILAAAAEKIAALSIGQLITAGVSIAALIGALVGVSKLLTPKASMDLATLGAALLGIAGAVLVLTISAEKLANLSIGNLLAAGGAIGAMMVMFVGVTKFMTPKAATDMMGTAAAIAIISGAIFVLSMSVERLSALDGGQLAKATLTIIALFGAIAVLSNALPTEKTAGIMASIMSITVMLTVLTAAMFIIGNMDTGAMIKGTVGVGLMVGALVGMFLALSHVSKNAAAINSMIPMLLSISVAMAVMTAMVYALDGVDWSALGKAAIAIGLFVAGLAGIAAIGHFLGAGLSAASAAMLMFSLGIAVVAISIGFTAKLLSDAFEKFADSFDQFMDTLIRINSNRDAIVGGAQTLKDIADHGKMDLTLFGAALGALLLGMTGLENLDQFIDVMRRLGENRELVSQGAQTLKDIADHGKMDLTLFGTAIGSLLDGFNDNVQNLDPFMDSMIKLGNNAEGVSAGVQILKDLGAHGKWDLHQFGDALGKFMEGMGDNVHNLDPFMDAMTRLGTNSEQVIAGVNVLKSLKGDWGWSEMEDYGKAFKSLSDNFDNAGNIQLFVNPMVQLAANADAVRKGADVLKLLKGDWGWTEMEDYGNAFKSMSDNFDNAGNIQLFINPMVQLGQNADIVRKGADVLKLLGSEGGMEGMVAFGNTFKSVSDNLSSSGNLDAFVSGLTKVGESREQVQNAIDFLRNIDVSGIDAKTQEIKTAFDNLGNTLGDSLNLPDVSGKIDSFVSSITNAARGKHGAIKDAFYYAFGGAVDGIRAQQPHVKSSAERAASDGAQGARSAHSAFRDAGYYAGGGMVDGLEAQRGNIKAKAASIASEAAAAAKAALKVQSPSRVFMEIGRFTALGLAAGIENNKSKSILESTKMAEGVIKSATSTLDIHSPSRVFTGIGKNVNEGMAKGISETAHKPKDAMGKTLDGVISVTDQKTKDVERSGNSFVDTLVNQMNNNPFTKRLEKLMLHSKALYATQLKEKKIKDAEEAERKEDEREQIYRDVEESRQAIADAKRDASDAKQAIRDNKEDASNQKKAAAKNRQEAQKADSDATKIARQNRDSARKIEDSERKYKDSQQKIRDAEKKYRRALSKKERYEYEQYGTEAGVAFVDGVAVGLIDESEKLPTLHEIMRDVLYEELDKVKKEADDFIGIFEGVQTLTGSFKKLGDNTNELRRAFTRMSHASNPRAFVRNAGHVFDAVLNIGKEVVGLMDILDKFKPFLPGLLSAFDGMLPAIAPAISQFAPGLAAKLGGGLATALPAIAGPAMAIVGAVVGIGALIYDSGTDQIFLKFLRSIVEGTQKIFNNLPTMIANFLKLMLTGLKNLVIEVPRMIGQFLTSVIRGIGSLVKSLPDLIPEIVIALIDAFVEVVTTMPEVFVELAFAIIEAIIDAIFVTIPELVRRLPEMFVRIGEAIVDGFTNGIVGGFQRVGETIVRLGSNLVNGFKNFFGIRSPSRLMTELGGYLSEGLRDGIEGGEDKVINATDIMSERIRDSIQNAIDSLDETSDLRLEITPVLNMEDASAQIAGLETSAHLLASQTASAANSLELAGVGAYGEGVTSVTNITYTQNNTSPKPLDTIEIYRQTERQLDNMK